MKRSINRKGLHVVGEEVTTFQNISDEMAEVAVINCLVFGGQVTLEKYIGFILPEFFTDASLRTAYRAIQAMHKDGLVIESGETLIHYYRKVPSSDPERLLVQFFKKLTAGINIANADAFVNLLATKYRGRKLQELVFATWQTANDTNRDPDELIAQLRGELDKVQATAVLHTGALVSETMDSQLDRIADLAESGVEMTGISTGFNKLDKATLGLQKGDVTILAAASSMGKTALALSMARHQDEHSGQYIFFSSQEQKREQIEQRLLSIDTGINLARLRAPAHLSEEDAKKLRIAREKFRDSKIIIEDRIMTPEATTSEWIRAAMKYDIGVFYLDYLQYCAGTVLEQYAMNERIAISQTARHFKSFASSAGLPVVLLSQIKREAIDRCRLDPDARPRKEDMDGSSTVEKDADLVIIVHRPYVYFPAANPKRAELIIDKQRNGPTGTHVVEYVDTCTLFRDRIKGHLMEED